MSCGSLIASTFSASKKNELERSDCLLLPSNTKEGHYLHRQAHSGPLRMQLSNFERICATIDIQKKMCRKIGHISLEIHLDAHSHAVLCCKQSEGYATRTVRS